jgi:predicted TIM-barrel fold metal-dependent hydrolase
MTIDTHAHWKPPALINALRRRTEAPRITRNGDGIEVLATAHGEQTVESAFDDVEARLAEMDRHGISTGVLSLLGAFSWIERLPLEEGLPLIRLHNDGLSELCAAHGGRFAAFASIPQTDMDAAAEELERAVQLPGIVGTLMPGNAFHTRNDAERARPVLEVANRHRAVIFVHYGPRPGDSWPRVGNDADNLRRRNGTLDMQASLSSNMVTLCLTDFLDPYPDATVLLHNLGGNIPFEVERMDHRCLLDTPDEELPSARFAKSKVMVDCNSFGPRAIEAGVRLYGADRIVFGTDGTDFGGQWSVKAVADADIGDAARQKIFRGNAAAMFSHLAPLAQYGEAAE